MAVNEFVDALILTFMLFSLRSVLEDLKSMTVFPREIILGTICLFLIRLYALRQDWSPVVVVYLCAVLTFLLIHLFSRGKLGLGDVFFSGFVSLIADFWFWNQTVLVAVGMGFLLFGGKLLLKKRLGAIPFVPLLFLSALLGFVFRKWGVL